MEVAIIRAVFMKIKMNNRDWLDKQGCIVAYLDSVQARLASLREWWSSRASAFLARIETQSASGEELRYRRTLMSSVLDRAFKGEL
jgi:hypothetical protein